jgi:hypothetical protein
MSPKPKTAESSDGGEVRSNGVSRRNFLLGGLSLGALAAGTAPLIHTPMPDGSKGQKTAESTASKLRPVSAVPALLDALQRFPLVAVTERHMLQEWHDVIAGLLRNPSLPGKVNDIVVEFGNSAYQELSDRFVLSDKEVARADLVKIWRQIGDPTWNAPVYEQFFHTVRAVNWQLPAKQRIRILLGQAPVSMNQVLANPHDRSMIREFVDSTSLNRHYADVVGQEVLDKGRRALLFAGGGHVLRGLQDDSDPKQTNAATRIESNHPNSMYVVDLLILPPGPPQSSIGQRVHSEVMHWAPASIAPIAGTWLGGTRQSDSWINGMSSRATSAIGRTYEKQADAVLYLAPGNFLTASQPDPAIYHYGNYPIQLRKLSHIVGVGNQVMAGLKYATAGPSWFSLW